MGAIAVTIPQSGFTVQGNKRVHYGTLTGSSSYATSGDTYTTLPYFGMNVMESLTVWPQTGYIAEWNSGADTVIFRRDTFTRQLVISGIAATAGAAMSVGWPALSSTGTVTITMTALRGGPVVNLQHTGSTAADVSTQISTSDTTSVQTYFVPSAAAGLTIPLYALTGGTLMTTATTYTTTMFIPIADGSLLPVTSDTTAGQRLLFTDSAATGLMIRATSSSNITITASTTQSMGSLREVASGTSLTGVTFRFVAVGV